jgi:hypothetical protein
VPSDLGLPVSRSVLSMTSAQGATHVGEHFIGRDSVSDGQRPILILAASCDRVNRAGIWVLAFVPRGRREVSSSRGQEPLGGVAQRATTSR